MKKTVLGLVLVGMLGLVGCGGQQTGTPAQTDTQAAPAADQAGQVGGTSVNVNDQGVNVQSGDTSVNVNPEGGVSVETGK